MGQQNPDMDVESAQKSGRRRGGCLDAFLVLSVIFLFVAVTAVAVGGVMVVMELRSRLETARPPLEFHSSMQTGDSPAPAYKMQNFVYLEASSSELQNSTMNWVKVHYGPGESVGSNFLFDKTQHSVMPKQAGTYFMYVELNLSCTHECKAGLLIVQVDDQLTCEVELPAKADKRPVSKKCWTVRQLQGQKLITQMTVPKAGLQNWKLELSGSGFGMFLVD